MKSPFVKKPVNDEDEAIDSEREEAMEQSGSSKKSHRYIPYEPFADLVNSQLFQTLCDYGSSVVPLSLVGLFMNYAGNHLLSHIWQRYNQKIFYPRHKVISMQLLSSGDILVTALKNESITVTFRCRAIVVSNGGKQKLHPSFYKDWFPSMREKKDRVFLSDQFM